MRITTYCILLTTTPELSFSISPDHGARWNESLRKFTRSLIISVFSVNHSDYLSHSSTSRETRRALREQRDVFLHVRSE